MAFRRPYGEAATIDGIPLITAGANDYQANPTLASGDVKISKDGGSFTNLATLPVVTPAGGKAVRISLSATEMQCARAVIQFIDQTATKEWEDQSVIVETENNASAQHNPVTDLLAGIVEGTETVKKVCRYLLAWVGAKATGGDTANPAFRDQADSKDRISMTVDEDGNRTAVTLDGDD